MMRVARNEYEWIWSTEGVHDAAKSLSLCSTANPRRRSSSSSIGRVPPFLVKSGDSLEGVDASVFESIQKAASADRYAFFTAITLEAMDLA
jgi:hypothetical protein